MNDRTKTGPTPKQDKWKDPFYRYSRIARGTKPPKRYQLTWWGRVKRLCKQVKAFFTPKRVPQKTLPGHVRTPASVGMNTAPSIKKTMRSHMRRGAR